jgi:hypothetical protein
MRLEETDEAVEWTGGMADGEDDSMILSITAGAIVSVPGHHCSP